MWKRLIIKIAWTYLDKLFSPWLAGRSQQKRNAIQGMILSFEMYLRTRRSKTSTYIADLLIKWRE